LNGFLLDTNVISELRKRERCNAGVRRWFSEVAAEELFLSVLVVGELRGGVERIRRRDAAAARALDAWLRRLEHAYQDHILPVTLEICDRWGRLGLEQPLSPIDGLLAATALQHDIAFVTLNVADVARSGVDVLNPFGR
jgi:predicted nucleic acid-binding protein